LGGCRDCLFASTPPIRSSRRSISAGTSRRPATTRARAASPPTRTPTNTIAYNSSGAPAAISDGTGTSSTLDTTLTYGGGTGNGGQVAPSSVQTPFSAPKHKAEKTHRTFYGYDSSGNLTSVNQDGEAGKPEAKLAYEPNGQVKESTDPDGNKTKYEYNEKHDLVEITPPSPLGATELTYDSIDRVHTVKDARGSTATYVYDGEDRVTNVEYSDGSSVSFKFDADGNTTERVDAKGFGEPYTGATYYEYDKLNRPILETTPTGKSTRYGYDYDGNLTSVEDAGGAVAYAYGSDDLLTSLTEPENSGHPFKFDYEAGDDNRESTTYPNGLLQCTKTDPGGRLTKLVVSNRPQNRTARARSPQARRSSTTACGTRSNSKKKAKKKRSTCQTSRKSSTTRRKTRRPTPTTRSIACSKPLPHQKPVGVRR
jgi:YD repeat-containing protein